MSRNLVISEKMGIDDIDCQIMGLIQQEPNLTHTEIATHVNRSQPTVGMRIKKLEKLGVLKYQAGINMKEADLCFARIEVQTKTPLKTIKTVRRCPFLLNAFRLSGKSNVSILAAGLTINDLDKVINRHFRNDPEVISVQLDEIAEVADDLVLPIDLFLENGQLDLKNYCCECKDK